MPLPRLPLRQRRVFVDSSVYLALLDTDDEHHSEATQLMRQLAHERYRQFTTNVLLIESHALILSVLGRARAARFLIQAPDDLASFLRYPLERVLMRGGEKRCGAFD